MSCEPRSKFCSGLSC
ncbi:hypothetical protein LINPERHAP1_LOCUS25537 [Linum perenne]